MIKRDVLIEKFKALEICVVFIRAFSNTPCFYNSNHRPSQRGYQVWWLWSLYHRPSNDLSKSFTSAYNTD
jgi:hypothetical protein